MAGVIFDGDDTLWVTEHLYDDARRAARRVVEAAGFDGATWENLQRARDLRNIARFGHDPVRFPTSCVEALADVGGDEPALQERVWAAAASVFEAVAPLRPEAPAALDQLNERGLRLGLLTKGDRAVQQHRLDDSGLRCWFSVVSIVNEKSPEAFRAVADAMGCPPHELLSVGNSVRSDALPSMDAGIRPLWIPAYVWQHERHDTRLEAGLDRIDDLLAVVRVVDDIRARQRLST